MHITIPPSFTERQILRIAFTGHRDKFADPAALRAAIPSGAVCVHGGAVGFDSQVDAIARAAGLAVEVIRPDYRLGRGAPLVRNRQIVESCDALIACYDGRAYGGTFYTIKYARSRGKPVYVIPPDRR